MAKEKSGLVINIGSIVGNVPTPWAGVYASSKAAIHAWSEVLRMEVKVSFIFLSLSDMRLIARSGTGTGSERHAHRTWSYHFWIRQETDQLIPPTREYAPLSLSLSLPDQLSLDSLYKSVANHIIARAEISQRPGPFPPLSTSIN